MMRSTSRHTAAAYDTTPVITFPARPAGMVKANPTEPMPGLQPYVPHGPFDLNPPLAPAPEIMAPAPENPEVTPAGNTPAEVPTTVPVTDLTAEPSQPESSETEVK